MKRKEYKKLLDELYEANKKYVIEVTERMYELGIEEVYYDGTEGYLHLDGDGILYKEDVDMTDTTNVKELIDLAMHQPEINSTLDRIQDTMAKSISDAIFFLQH